MKLHKIISYLSIKLSLIFFKLRMPISYVIFNKLYSSLILKKNINSKLIKLYDKNGFVKLDINFKTEILDIEKDLSVQEVNPTRKIEVNSTRKIIKLNKNKQEEFLQKIINKLTPTINQLKQYYNSEIYIAKIMATRNLNRDAKADGKYKELYSNHYHNDGYLITYFKIFINLMDITENDGPLHIIYKNEKKKFIKLTNYKNRHNYLALDKSDILYKNTGKKGDVFLFSTPLCFHKAGIPKNYRDNLGMELIAVPHKMKISLSDIYNDDFEWMIKITKPYSNVELFKKFIDHYRYKKTNF